MKLKLAILTFLSVCLLGNLSAKDYNASFFGIKSDGVTMNTGSIQKAVDFISETGGGKLTFYVGRYLTGSIELKSNVTIELRNGAILMGVASAFDYDNVDGSYALFYAKNKSNIVVTGVGSIEAQGPKVVDSFSTMLQKGYIKGDVATVSPRVFSFTDCSNIKFDGITIKEAAGDALVFTTCRSVNVKGIYILSKAVPACKGIVLSDNTYLTIADCFFDTSGAPISGTSNSITLTNNKTTTGEDVTLAK